MDVSGQTRIVTREMHTAGEPLRIVESGYPHVLGETILEKRKYAREKLDELRKFLMFEPRGHSDMYGVILVEPDHPKADVAVLFMHNAGYSTMCGHAVIALGRYVVDKKIVALNKPETQVNIQCPCGLVKTFVDCSNGVPGKVRFLSVPAFAFDLDVAVEVEGHGKVKVDIGYGGAFYALISAEKFGFSVRESSVRDLTEIATKVDRSPTGSGVTARLAVQYKRGLIGLNQSRAFRSVIGTTFTGSVVETVMCGDFTAVVAEVSGEAFYSGSCTFTTEDADQLKSGFVLK
ncbi:hypothetical protein LSH36_26g04068 [Paralvinella palmiformis]|uniref:trans-L-3-hydroxyproline dehydratase n=1 Tax=Paralvinella palmiformis TaxID=53620 RepID=A0AAD9NGB2_9ANNE|nr:hypothetical protein LSH36_26g04068 [Paralvinella palmiformis]